jgi:hypothetical protein
MVSCCSRLAAALDTSKKNGLPRYETLQPEYSLVEREGYEAELEPLCEREKVAVINYFPLASGFLTGKYRSEEDLKKGTRGQFVKKYSTSEGLELSRPGQSGEAAQCHPGAGCPCMVPRAAEHYCTYCQRNEFRSAQGSYGFSCNLTVRPLTF